MSCQAEISALRKIAQGKEVRNEASFGIGSGGSLRRESVRIGLKLVSIVSSIVCTHSIVSDSATLWTVALQAPLSMGFSMQERWSGLPCSPPGDLTDPAIEPVSLVSPALAGIFFNTHVTWKAPSWQ